MPKTSSKLVLSPVDLDCLARALKLDELLCDKPALEKLISSLPLISLEAWPQGSEIVRQGERGEDLFVVYSGRLSVWHKGRAAPLCQVGTLKPGDFFGEIGFLLKAGRTATVRCEEECRIFHFPAKEFASLLTREKLLERWVQQVACQRLARMFSPEP